MDWHRKIDSSRKKHSPRSSPSPGGPQAQEPQKRPLQIIRTETHWHLPVFQPGMCNDRGLSSYLWRETQARKSRLHAQEYEKAGFFQTFQPSCQGNCFCCELSSSLMHTSVFELTTPCGLCDLCLSPLCTLSCLKLCLWCLAQVLAHRRCSVKVFSWEIATI